MPQPEISASLNRALTQVRARHENGGLRNRDLTDALHISRAHASYLLGRLVDLGLVRKIVVRGHNRYRLTPKGQRTP